jgi:hypothetical protein
MRLEYSLELSEIEVPRFSVEAQERIGKLFTLATLVFNVLDAKPVVEIVFHGLNPQDPSKKIAAFREIVASVESSPALTFDAGPSGHIAESSIYFQWLTVRR